MISFPTHSEARFSGRPEPTRSRQYDARQQPAIDIDGPCRIGMNDKVPGFIQNMPGTHGLQDFLRVGIGDRVFEFEADRPDLRPFSTIVALSSDIRTRAFCPFLPAISPSRIRTLRMMARFHPSLATRNLRSISSGMSNFPGQHKQHSGCRESAFDKDQCHVAKRRPNSIVGWTPNAALIPGGIQSRRVLQAPGGGGRNITSCLAESATTSGGILLLHRMNSPSRS